jgi:hypothetical protein
MSLLKTNEIQNYNGSSLTLTASTVSTSAQLNTGGNISVTGSLNVSDDSTTRTNLGLGTIATQDSSNVSITGGTLGSNVDLKAAINASGSAPVYACRAWVNFNGTGTVAIRDSGNVSSITDNGGTGGDYTVNFATAMPDANYCVSVTTADANLSNNRYSHGGPVDSSSAKIFNRNGGTGTLQDDEFMLMAIFR